MFPPPPSMPTKPPTVGKITQTRFEQCPKRKQHYTKAVIKSVCCHFNCSKLDTTLNSISSWIFGIIFIESKGNKRFLLILSQQINSIKLSCRLHRNELSRATVREVLHIRRRIRIISIISPQACGSYKGFSNKSCWTFVLLCGFGTKEALCPFQIKK